MRSLRARLLCRTCGVMTLTLVIAAAVLFLVLRASLFAELDASLLLEATSLATHVERSGDEIQIESAVALVPEYSSAERPHYFQIWAADGRTAFRSPSLAERDLPFSAGVSKGVALHLSSELPNGMPGRIAVIRFEPRLEDDEDPPDPSAGRPAATIAVARDTFEIDATLARLATLSGAVTIATVFIGVVLTGSVVSRELKPLRTLAGTIEQLDSADMSQRIDIGDCPTELQPVVDRLNQLLGRVEATLAREKSFTADVAHELRTPLAGLETTLEVCASRPRDADAYQAAIANCLGITRSLHFLVDNLLRLARADSNQFPLDRQPLDIAACARECWSPFADRAAGRGLRTEWVLDDSAQVLCDHEAARQILANLFDNAVTYADNGGQIRTLCNTSGNRCVVTIANSGCALNPGDVAKVFDRFWRGDAARSSAGLHCGLGLALCKKHIELHDGNITAEIRDGWFSIHVELDTAAARA